MSTGVLAERRGYPVYRTNPSVPRSGDISRQRRVQLGEERKGFVINEAGEILGTGVAVTYEWEEVDDERFVKLFLAGLKQATGLSKRGMAVFQMVYDQLRENPRQDTVMLSVLTSGLPKTSFYIGLRALLDLGFIYHGPADGMFFVNIRYMFNGDRLAFVKAYHRKSPDRRTHKAASQLVVDGVA